MEGERGTMGRVVGYGRGQVGARKFVDGQGLGGPLEPIWEQLVRLAAIQ